MQTLQPEVLAEPKMALQAEENGLYFYRILSDRYRSFLKKNGWLVFEIGYLQGNAVSQLLLDNGFTDVRVIPDYNGNNRVVIGQLKSN